MDKKNIYANKLTIPNCFCAKTFVFNDINSGFTRLEELGVAPASFWGGNVEKIGFKKEYGFYIVVSMHSGNVLGVYVHDSGKLTKAGREFVTASFPKHNVVFGERVAEPEPVTESPAPAVKKTGTDKAMEDLLKENKIDLAKIDINQFIQAPNVSPLAAADKIMHEHSIKKGRTVRK